MKQNYATGFSPSRTTTGHRTAMGRLLLMTMLLFAFMGGARAQETLTVHDGTTTNQYIPAYIFYFDDFTRSQFVIPATELADMSGGTINAIKFYTTSDNIPYTTVSTVDVYLMEVDYTTMTALEPKANGTIVYQGTLDVVTEGSGGSLTIEFSTPYSYGGGNLLVGIENTTDAGYKKILFYGETVTGASWGGANSSNLDGVTGEQKNFIPKTTFTYEPASTGCDMPTSIAVTNITPNSANVTWEGEGSKWNLRYKASTDADYTLVEGLTTKTYNLTGLAENTAYSVGVQTDCGGSTSSFRSISFTTANPCAAPTNLVVTDVTPSSATLSWTAGYQETSWTVKYKKSTEEDFTVETVNGTPTITLSSLDGLTTYNVQVYNCTNEGSPYLSGNFTTAASFPYSQDFSASGIPTGWTQYTGLLADVMGGAVLSTATSGWSNGTSNGVLDGNNIYSNIYGTTRKNWIVTPAIPLGSNARITFDVAYTAYSGTATNPQTTGEDDKFVVLISTDNMATWTILRQWDNAGSSYVLNNLTPSALHLNFDLSAYAGQSAIVAFYAESTVSNADNNIHVDNVVFEVAPSCEKPYNVAVNYTGGLTAEVTWEGEASSYNINVNGTVTEGVTSPYTLEGLELATDYTVEVQAVCSDTEQSEWTNPVSFTTDACMPEDMIIVNYTLNDSYGDGWGNNYILVVNEDCNLADYVTLDNGSTGTGTIKICGSYAQFLWYAGDYPGETSWTFTDTDGNVLFSGSGSSDMATYDVLYTIDKNPYPRPTDLAVANVGPFSAELSWTENGSATEWEIGFVNSEGNIVSSITADSNPFTLSNLNAETTYTLQLRSIGNKGMSLWTCDNITFTTASVAGAKPYDLSVTPYPAKADVSWNGFTENYNLEWTVAPTIVPTPASSSESSLWLQYDIDNYVTNIGGSTSNEQTWGTMYPARMFEGNNNLSKVAIMETSYYTMDSYTVNIYSGGETAPGTLVGTQTVAPAGSDGMHVITLDSPITIDPMQNLWITVTATGTYIKAACSGTESNNQWTLNNGSWVCVADLNSSLAGYGWMIRGYVEGYNPDAYEWNTVTGITSPYTIESLQPETTYIVKVQSDFDTAGLSKWTWNIFTTPSVTDDPIELAATDIKATKATLSWTGYQDNYNVQYRTATKYDAVWEDDFENGLDNWTIGHADNATAPANGYWYTIDPTNGLSFVSHGGTNCASSWSWNNSAYHADNWLITPQLELQGILKFYVRTNSSYPDSYEVLLSTTGNAVTYTYDESDTNHENPIFTGDFTTTLQAMAAAPDNGEWNEVVIDLSAYTGQLGYIAIHHQDDDMNYLLIDDFGIYNYVPAGEWVSATSTEPTLTISGLTPETQYDWLVQGIYDDGTTEWVSGDSFTTKELVEIELVNDDSESEDKKNSVFIADNVGKYCEVLLSDRTLFKDDNWNTICLPFDVDLTAPDCPLDGAIAKTLTNATVTKDESLTHIALTFGDAVKKLEAGVPYIIKWATDPDGKDVADPVFTDVLIKNVPAAYRTLSFAEGKVQFTGYYDAFAIESDDIFYMTADSKLKNGGIGRIMKSCRAFFQFSDDASTAREFVLNFGDSEATGISEIEDGKLKIENGVYDLQGRSVESSIFNVQSSMLKKGLYIQNGKKVVIK